MDIIKALETFKKLELKMQDLYAYYEKLYATDKEVSDFFLKLSLDEKSHADLVDCQLRNIKGNRSMFNDVEFDMDPINELISEIESRLSSKEPVSLEEEWHYAMEMESSALENHYRSLLSESSIEMVELIKKLESSDKGHLDKLRVLGKSRGYLD